MIVNTAPGDRPEGGGGEDSKAMANEDKYVNGSHAVIINEINNDSDSDNEEVSLCKLNNENDSDIILILI